MVDALSGKVFLIITGASRGIGAEIAQQFSRLLAEGSHILLMARDLEKLRKNAEKMPKSVTCHCENVDLSVATKDELKAIILKALGDKGVQQYDRAVIVHNAATIGDLSKSTKDMDDLEEWRRYCDLNLFSPIILNSVFMNIFTDVSKVSRLVINVTSLCAIEPMKSSGFYNTGKAAREMFFKTFAAEFPTVNVLNWSPGPVDTDMFDTLTKESSDPQLRAKFNDLRDNHDILTPEQSTNRLIMVLKHQSYKSGDHVDYYDQL
ncbi:sepiapterin reductase-like [Venturia canescens]|uniref:sepiapterin reductase-like n=1 Tax=Venturia canescens TaxID=32260 RepID=UPI001C9C5ED1|nr:sepiapterin reductase-like [Venturia canescens]